MRCRSVRSVTGQLVAVVAMLIVLAACGSDSVATATYSDAGSGTAETDNTTDVAESAEATEETVSSPTEAPSPTEVPVATEVPAPAAVQEPTVIQEPAAIQEQTGAGDGLFPTIVGAVARSSDGLDWRFDVTVSSEYDSPDRYADAWRVLDANDVELGIRILGHDHANEQPFTRSTNVDIPGDIQVVFVEGRDQLNGWSGERFEVVLAR